MLWVATRFIHRIAVKLEMHFRYVLARIADEFVDVVPGLMPDTAYVVWGYEDDLVQMRAEPSYVASNPVFSLIQTVNALQR